MKRACALLALCSGLFAGPACAGTDGYVSEWVVSDGSALLEISHSGEGVDIRLVRVTEAWVAWSSAVAGRLGEHNPDPTQRARALEGIIIGRGLAQDGDGALRGVLYDPASGRTYKSRIELVGPDTLSVRGYVGVQMWGRTTTWARKPRYRSRMLALLGAGEEC